MKLKSPEEVTQYLRKNIEYSKMLAFIFFIASFATAATIVIYGEIFKHTENLCRAILSKYPFGIFALSPVAFISSFVLVQKFAPFSSGSGIPQVMVASELTSTEVNNPFLRALLSIKTALVKIASSLLGVLGGGAIGREGPSLHVSAAFFYFFYRVFNKIHKNVDHTLWVITGAAAGLAAAFNTPLGGIVYAIEELGSRHFAKIRTHLLISILISGLVSQTLLGGYLYIGSPKTNPSNYKLLFFVIIAAYLLGVLGSLFGQVLFKAMNWRRKFKSTWSQWALIFVLSQIVAVIIFFDHNSLGAGKEYINQLLFDPQHMQIYTPFLRLLNTFISYITGIAGGIFAPSLSIGAGIGYYIGEVYNQLTGVDNTNVLVLCGMISFLTAVTRTPFTSFILVLEMTDRHASIIPMMTSALVSSYAAHSLYKQGFYELTRDFIFKNQAPRESTDGKTKATSTE